MQTRREMLAHGATVSGLALVYGLVPGRALAAWSKEAFDAKTLAEVTKALGAASSTASKEVSITAPDIAENGAVVPMGAACSLPGVKRLAILVEKNPNALAALFDLTDAVEPSIATRVKMGQSSNVFAVAVMADGKLLFAQKEVKVTLGGCGG